MTELVLPYAGLESIFESIEYRATPAQPFQALEIDGDMARQVVRVDDLRTIPQHQLRVHLRGQALKPHYERHRDDLRFIILVRETALRRELCLADYSIDAIPDTIDLDRNQLRTTAMRDALRLDLCVIAANVMRGSPALPTQRASRLAELQIVLTNTAGGASFPFRRVSAEEMKRKELPGETGVHLELLCDPIELIKESDTPLRNLLEVWVHEKVWAAVQNDRSAAASSMRLVAVTLTVVHLLLSTVAPVVKGGQEIHANSAVGQLLTFVEKQAGLRTGHLRQEFQEKGSVSEIDPYLQNAWRFVSSAARVPDEEMVE